MNKEILKERLNEVAQRNELKGASLSITLKDKNYKVLYGYNSNKFLVAASNIKVLITATALHVLGKDYQFQTKIYHTGRIENNTLKGNLIIRGFGDPSFGSRDFEDTKPKNVFNKIVEILRENLIREIEGTVIVDNSFIENKFLYVNWSLEDFPYYYGAIPNAVNFLDNYFPIKQNGTELTTEIIDAVDADLLLRECKIIEDESIEGLRVFGCPYCEKKTVFLNPKLDAKKYIDYKVALAKPNLVFADSFARYLATKNIKIKNGNIADNAEERKQIGIVLSPPLLEILKNINFKSNNLFANSIYQVLLKIFNEKQESLNDYWLKTIGNNKFYINDGSGQSRTSFLTTDFTTELLMFMYLNNDNFGDFFGTLPQLGKEGTVKDFCKDVEAKNVVRFKTGSMSRVRGFAGIIEGDEQLSFSIIINNYQCTDTEIRTLAENIFKEFALA